MDTAKLIKFKDLLTTINQIIGVSTPVTFFFISNDEIRCKKGLSLYDLSNFDYVMVVGEYEWKNGGYTNRSAKLIGFFNRDLELIESIPVSDEVNIMGIDFTTYPSSYYDAYQPIFVCSKNGKCVSFKLDNCEGWGKDFQTLYNLTKS